VQHSRHSDSQTPSILKQAEAEGSASRWDTSTGPGILGVWEMRMAMEIS
jgi:hypothetical protein